jgi:DnaK suppressor protein
MIKRQTPLERHGVLDPDDLAALRRRLSEEKERLLALYHGDVHAAREIREEGVEDLEELATMDVDREMLYSMSELELERLREIEEALQRMADGTYGICLYSGEPIPVDRLHEIPWARFRADVQRLVEEGVIDGERAMMA